MLFLFFYTRYVNSLIKVKIFKIKKIKNKFLIILICKKVNVYALNNQIFY